MDKNDIICVTRDKNLSAPESELYQFEITSNWWRAFTMSRPIRIPCGVGILSNRRFFFAKQTHLYWQMYLNVDHPVIRPWLSKINPIHKEKRSGDMEELEKEFDSLWKFDFRGENRV